MPARPSISVVVVAHNSLSDLRRALPALIGQLDPEDELLVVDSGSGDGLAARLPELAPDAKLIAASGNVGFATGANLGAASALGDLIVLLNPDAVVQPGWADAIREPWGGDWDAWMALVTMEDGETINTSGGVLHFTGIGWAGQAGRPVAEAPSAPCSVGFLSGACLALPAVSWRRLGGFPDEYFMYCEDVDLSLRIRLLGGSVAVIPGAKVLHAYDFDKGPGKWRLLERNRRATIIRCFPTPLLVLSIPALVGAEVAVWYAAVRGGWARAKALAELDLLRSLPGLMRARREIQRARVVDAYAFAAGLSSELGSPYLNAGFLSPGEAALRFYWLVVLCLLRLLAALNPSTRRLRYPGHT